MNRLLWRSSYRYQRRHRVQLALTIVGVALGVAGIYAIDAVNRSARTAFRLSTAAVAGRATHHVVAAGGVPDSVYTMLRVSLGFRDCAPIVEGVVGVDGTSGRAFRLVGVDPFAEAPFRTDFAGAGDLTAFLLTPNGVMVPASLAATMNLQADDALALSVDGRRAMATVVGSYGDIDATRGYDDVLLADVATAQEMLSRAGTLSRIDLIIAPEGGDEALDRIRDALPPGATIERSQTRSARVEDMTTAFSQNLFALSLLALIVGMFLIYNTMTFSVVQRRTLIGDLRALGVTGREIFGVIVGEALVVGVVGTALGIIAGHVLASKLLGFVTQTINDLYFIVNTRNVVVSAALVVKAIVLGVGATVVSAMPPAREATRTPPRSAQRRSAANAGLRERSVRLAWPALILVAVGVALLAVPTRRVLVGFAGLLPLIAGFSLFTPALLTGVAGRRRPAWRLGLIERMALRGIVTNLGRSSVAIAALAVAVGTTVGVTIMIQSFRATVVDWLEMTLDADVYISAPGFASSRDGATLRPDLVRALPEISGVTGVNFIRALQTQTQHGIANLVAIAMVAGSEGRYRLLDGDSEQAWPAFDAGGGVLVSEPYANRHAVGPGDSIRVGTPGGYRSLPIAAVYQDYASDVGTVLVSMATFRSWWNDDKVSGAGLFLDDNASTTAVMARVREIAGSDHPVLVRSNRDLRDASMEVFDRTFAITNILRLLTIVIAFIGVLSALMALLLERAREYGVLRALGLTPAQLRRLVTAQSAFMGLFAGVLSLPFGLILAVILVYVINKRSFGWTLDMHISVPALAQALLLAITAAVLAGIYPGRRMSQTSPARALREE